MSEPRSERRVGVELEFGGLDLERATAAVVRALGGRAEADGDYRRRVRATRLGDFQVELDFELLHDLNARRHDRGEPDALADFSEDLLATASGPLVPVEVVSPPLPAARLGELAPLTAALRAAGAVGTRGSWLWAFGLHLNPELAGVDAGSVRDHLRAYLCLHDWLVAEEEVDWSRRLVPYIKPFSRDYARLVLAPGYAPDMARLIDDYLAHNPDRNRSLDLLPLFAWLDRERVLAAVDDPRIKARPTWHYRLPNCEIDRPGWSILPAWKRWLQVESVAADRRRLETIRRAYLRRLDHPIEALGRRWPEQVSRWLVAG